MAWCVGLLERFIGRQEGGQEGWQAYRKSLSAHFLVIELWDGLSPYSRLCAHGHCSLCAKKMSTWVATLPPGKPLLFWMAAQDLKAACRKGKGFVCHVDDGDGQASIRARGSRSDTARLVTVGGGGAVAVVVAIVADVAAAVAVAACLIYRDLNASFTLPPSLCFMYFNLCLCVASGHPKLGCIPNEGSVVQCAHMYTCIS